MWQLISENILTYQKTFRILFDQSNDSSKCGFVGIQAVGGWKGKLFYALLTAIKNEILDVSWYILIGILFFLSKYQVFQESEMFEFEP